MPPRRALADSVGLGLVLALVAVLYGRSFGIYADYDESVYLAAADAFRHGQPLGSEVFTAQPPAFYFLVAGGEWLVGTAPDAVRAVVLVFTLGGSLAAYAIGRAVSGHVAGLVAAAALAIVPPFPTFAIRVYADILAVDLALVALALALARGRDRWDGWRLGLAGALLTFAFFVKFAVIVFVVPIVALVILRRSRRAAVTFAGGVVACAAAILLPLVPHLGGLWHGAVDYHRAARSLPAPGIGDNFRSLVHFLEPDAPSSWLVYCGVLATVWQARRLDRRAWCLWALAPLSFLGLLLQVPLHDNHWVLYATGLAVPAGTFLGGAVGRMLPSGWQVAIPVAIAIVLLFGAGYAKEWRRLGRSNTATGEEVKWAARELARRTRPDDLVVSDRPIVLVEANRRSVGDLVDTASLRFASGFLTERDVLAQIDRHRVPAVVTARIFRLRPELLAALRERFPRRTSRFGVTVYFR